MKLLLLHSDFVEWEPKKKALASAEKAAKKPVRVREALVAFSSVEKGDEKNPTAVAGKAISEIEDVAKQVKAKKIVVYPYVHLSQSPGSPGTALKVLKAVEAGLKKSKGKLTVRRAPFGWYKAFNIKCKGHPLSELSRDISAGGVSKGAAEEVSDAVKKEETLKSNWYILEPSGKMNKIELKDGMVSGFDMDRHKKLEKLCLYEMAKSREVREQPPHIKLMKRLELVGYEPGSDPGHFRFLPKGQMVKSLLEQWVSQNMAEYGAVEVETPMMYDYEHPSLKSYMNRFPARQYTVETPNKRVFLRFSACFGQFLMAHDANISYRSLPLKMYELTRSFRVEQRGELAGLRRLRAFTMPDCHAICADMKQAKEENLKRFELANKVENGAGLEKGDFEFSIRTVSDFLKKDKAHILKIAKKWGKPVLMEVWDKRFFYFVLKLEWNFIDALNKAACLATDQIDIENAERYGIYFTDKGNKKKLPLVLHLSPSGSIERVMYALLEKACMKEQARKNNTMLPNPILPLWLSPTQIRLCPMNESLVSYCETIADRMQKECIRVDIDDRVESVGKKIRDAETEWIPLIVVIGDKEKKTGKLAVRFRETGKVKALSAQAITKQIKKDTDGKPFRPLPLPRLLTKRPVFVA